RAAQRYSCVADAAPRPGRGGPLIDARRSRRYLRAPERDSPLAPCICVARVEPASLRAKRSNLVSLAHASAADIASSHASGACPTCASIVVISGKPEIRCAPRNDKRYLLTTFSSEIVGHQPGAGRGREGRWILAAGRIVGHSQAVAFDLVHTLQTAAPR